MFSRRQENDIPHSAEDVDAIMAAELNRMSLQERERTYEEVHGVDQVIEESEAFVSESLLKMGQEVQKISNKTDYETAWRQSPDYVESTRLWMSFLRAESFHPQKAAFRIVKFFEGKRKYFGEEMLTRPITLEDLSSGARALLKAGHFQFLTERDRAGRLVLIDTQAMDYPVYDTVKDVTQALLYMMMCAAEDEENQKRGIVAILYKVETPRGIPNPSAEISKETPKILHWVPLRIVGAHMCLDDPLMKAVAGILLMSAGANFRARYRVHSGTYTEVLYSLMSFGIPIDSFPISSDASVKKAAHTKWLTKRKVKEVAIRRGDTFLGIDNPGINDVLIGKGKPIQLHTGNINLRTIVAENWDEYSNTKKGEKGAVVRKVLQLTKTSGRFLVKRGNGWWFKVPDSEAIEKITKTFLSAGTKVNRGLPLKVPPTAFIINGGFHMMKKQRVASDTSACFGFYR